MTNSQNVFSAKCKMQNAKCKMQNAKCKMQNAKCKMQIIIYFGIIMLLFGLSDLNATTYSRLPSSSIDTMFIQGGGNIGDTVWVTARVKSLVSTKFKIGFMFGQGLKPVFTNDSINNVVYETNLDSGNVYSKTLPFILTDTVTHFSCNTLLDPLPTLLDFEPMNLRMGKVRGLGYESVLNIEDPNSDADQTISTEYEGRYLDTQENPTRTFKISGKVLFVDPTDNRTKGAITKVRLYFKYINWLDPNPYAGLILPSALNNNEYVEGVHYCETDTLGNYSFTLPIDPNSFGVKDDLFYVVVVEKENYALKLNSPSNHIDITAIRQNTPNFRIFDSYIMGNVRKPMGSNGVYFYSHGGKNIIINPADGHIFRYVSLSKLFLKRRFNCEYDQLPFNTSAVGDRIPMIFVYRLNTFYQEGLKGWYNAAENYIGLHTQNLERDGIFHEYGHYVDHSMMDFETYSYINKTDDNKEAFAMFYAMAVSAWNNSLYNSAYPNTSEKDANGFLITKPGEEIGIWGNLELAPTFVHWDDLNGFKNRGAGNLSSVRDWVPTPGVDSYAGSAYACFLWDLYDMREEPFVSGQSSPSFTADYIVSYKTITNPNNTINISSRGKSNDDMEFGKRIFELWNEYPSVTMSYFKEIIKAEPSNNVLVRNIAIDSLFDFLYDTNIQNVRNNPSIPTIHNNTTEKTLNMVSHSYTKYEKLDDKVIVKIESGGELIDYLKSYDFCDFTNFTNRFIIYNYIGQPLRVLNYTDDDFTDNQMTVSYAELNLPNTNIQVKSGKYYNIERVTKTNYLPFISYIPQKSAANSIFDFTEDNFYPNPSISHSEVKVNSLLPGSSKIKVINSIGSIVLELEASISEGENSFTIPTYSLLPGFYILSIDIETENGIENKTIKFIKAE